MRSHHLAQYIHCPIKTTNSISTTQPAGLLSPVHTSINSTCSSPLDALPVYHNRSTVPKLDCLHVCIRSPSPFLQLPPQHNPLRRKSETRYSNQNTITLRNKKHHKNHIKYSPPPPTSRDWGGGEIEHDR